MTRDLSNALSRLGREVPVWIESNSGSEDKFGQEEKAWSQDSTVLAVRTYINKNTTSNSGGGQRHRDRPIFRFPSTDAPPADARIKFDGTWYELDATTDYGTHVSAPGSKIIDNDFSP